MRDEDRGCVSAPLEPMAAEPTSNRVANSSADITWHPESRLALVVYLADANLVAIDGTLLVEALTGWIGADGKPFGLLVDARKLRGTNSEYRAKAAAFFRRRRNEAYIALTGMAPIVRIVTDMFRIGTGVQLKGFADEPSARAWLRSHGIAA